MQWRGSRPRGAAVSAGRNGQMSQRPGQHPSRRPHPRSGDHRRARSAAWALVATLSLAPGALLVHGACGSTAPVSAGGAGLGGAGTGAGDAGGAGTGAVDAGGAGGVGAAGGGPPNDCPGTQRPKGIPEGWVRHGDWSCDCRIYYAPSPELMPPPIQWEPCPTNPDPSVECRSMVIDWNDDEPFYSIGVDVSLATSLDGEPLLAFRRILPAQNDGSRIILDLVAEADGEVLWAFATHFDSESPGCYLVGASISARHAVIQATGTHHDEDFSVMTRNGALAAPHGERPTLRSTLDEPYFGVGWYASRYDHANGVPDAYLIEARSPGAELLVTPWDEPGSSTLVHSALLDPQGITWTNLVPIGDALFIGAMGVTSHGVSLWRKETGLVPFRRWLDDKTRGAASFGTDGVDMVWFEGQGKEPQASEYPEIHLMRAPFTLDPSGVTPSPVRLLKYTELDYKPSVVGCGRMARDAGVVAVFDLDDGEMHRTPTDLQTFAVNTPLGLDCDELWALGEAGNRLNILRVRLDTLPPEPSSATP
jgi:hypothetical protein